LWGLEQDHLHIALQAELDRAGAQGGLTTNTANSGQAQSTSTMPSSPTTQQGDDPLRLGAGPGLIKVVSTESPIPLLDETKWVAYVRRFCTRYHLDKAQRAAAHAILKDLQERAQNYRGARMDQIKKLKATIRQAESPQARREATAALRESLRPNDDLFEELKARLENIPTADQLSR
jgi:hypothetical protein